MNEPLSIDATPPRPRGRRLVLWGALVALLVVYHVHCGFVLKAFRLGTNQRSHVWYRFYNEMPVLVLFAVVFLAVLTPF